MRAPAPSLLAPRILAGVVSVLVAATFGLPCPSSTAEDLPPELLGHVPPDVAEAMKKISELPADNVRDAIDDPERPAADRERDEVEQPELLLRASGIARGMRVADLRAGDGYLAQLLAAAVRRAGRTWANNDPQLTSPAVAEAWTKRLADPSSADIGRLDNPLAKPLSAWANELQMVFARGAWSLALSRGVDRVSMIANVVAALRTGGRLVVVDARADDASSAEDAARLCRVPEALLRKELEAAGLRLVSSGTELHLASDDRRSSACDAEQQRRAVDRFLMVFEKAS